MDAATTSGVPCYEDDLDQLHGDRPATSPRQIEHELRASIEHTVAGAFEIEPELIRLPTRGQARIALARQVAMYVAHVAGKLTLSDVGRMFERDRTTVAHACMVVEQRRDDPDFDRAVELIESIVGILIGTQASTTN